MMETAVFKSHHTVLLDRRVWVMLLLGFSAGLPLLLIFGTLSLWLREAGVERNVVTMFSWAALGYSFKFVWAPLVDQLPLPVVTRLMGRRRSWLLFSQCMVILSILIISTIDPSAGGWTLQYMAFAAVMLGFSSATQDIVIDAFRIESAEPKMQALLSSTYIAGYRIAMLVAGAGALLLAEWLGSVAGAYDHAAWSTTYRIMALCMLIGVLTTLLVGEPDNPAPKARPTRENLQLLLLFICAVSAFVFSYVLSTEIVRDAKMVLKVFFNNSALAGLVVEMARLGTGLLMAWLTARFLSIVSLVPSSIARGAYFVPLQDFFQRYGIGLACLVLALIGMYRISDIVLGVIANVFYYEIGFSKSEVAVAAKTFGLGMTILGGFAGGLLAFRYGVMRILLLGAVLAAGTNLLFMALAQTGYNLNMLYVVIAADNLSAGLASAAFVAFLSALTNIRFTAVQYAIFSSLMTLLPKVVGGYSGAMVDSMDYSGFFIFTAILGIPVIVLIMMAMRVLSLKIPD